MNTIKDKISNVVEAVGDKVSAVTGGSEHDSVHTASKVPPAAPAGATYPVPGDRSVNGATDRGSIKTVPQTVGGGNKARLEQKVKEPTPSKMVTTAGATKAQTVPHDTVPVVAKAKAAPAPDVVPVVAVEAPKGAKSENVVPPKAVHPVATATVPVTKFSEADAYAVLPPAEAAAGSEGSTHSTQPVKPSDGLKEVNFHLAMGGTGHKIAVKGSWDNWAEEVDCSGDKGAMLRLKPGTYQYKYILDGQWVNDASGNTVTDADGNVNNVLEV
ncbi:hypothetical protein MMPV_002652 [Pyropia vietnamensis]